MHGGTPINKCARSPNMEKSACFPILDGFPVKIKRKKNKNAIQSPCLCTLHTKQIRYNLESEKYTVCIVQDKVGELVMPSGPVPLWNFCVRGNCSGTILSLLHTITGAHLWPLLSHHLHHTEHRSTSADVVFSERRHVFCSNNVGGISFLRYGQRLQDWPRGFWSGEITTCRRKGTDRSGRCLSTVLLYILKSSINIIGSMYSITNSSDERLQMQSPEKTHWNLLPLRQSLLMSRAEQISLEICPATNSLTASTVLLLRQPCQNDCVCVKSLFPVCEGKKKKIDSVRIIWNKSGNGRSTEPTRRRSWSYLWSGWETGGWGRQEQKQNNQLKRDFLSVFINDMRLKHSFTHIHKDTRLLFTHAFNARL